MSGKSRTGGKALQVNLWDTWAQYGWTPNQQIAGKQIADRMLWVKAITDIFKISWKASIIEKIESSDWSSKR